ncbi:hypothetical protein [Shewanella sp. 10N.286.48.A6]|uniref:hypothetical protein n=1 Tax=Shewanella sp. 10N.286.48.A6 TaxID=1880833 RepID=UPI000C82617A|nr:hypothetical protein [Shewanella sp. 10N.286.48.A6]PMI02519.1 hypothetical protein BCU55_06475 [Shewanella sp. 10N.286.48.A6]
MIAQVLLIIGLIFCQSVYASVRGVTQIGIEVDDISVRQFVSTQNGAELFYTLQAQTQLRTLETKIRFGFFLLQESAMAKLNHYVNGKFIIANQQYEFEKAYWFQGELILLAVTADMERGRFNTEKLRFNPVSRRLSADRFQLVTPTTFVRKSNWMVSVDNENFLPEPKENIDLIKRTPPQFNPLALLL